MLVPGPRGLPFLGHLPALGRNPLHFFRDCAQRYDGIVRFKVLRHDVYLLTEPSLIQEVLQTKAASFIKSADYRNLQAVFGSGLLTSDGSAWREQRRLLQPAFHHAQLHRYAEIMFNCAQSAVQSWKIGEVRDVHQDMMRITMQIVAQTLFETEIPGQVDLISAAVSAVFRDLSAASMFIPALRRVPTRRNRRWNKATQQLDRIIYGLIEEGRACSSQAGGLTGMLIRVRGEDGSALSNQQIRDELMTMFLAGHETTAVALSWTLYLLAQHPAVDQKLYEEVQHCSKQDGTVDALSYAALPYAKAVLQEAMRLYPPVWTIGREARTDVELNGTHLLPQGAQVWICQWIVHHDGRFFAAPEQFQPERWLSEDAAPAARFRYLPFGAGPRLCIGQSFAMWEAAIILANIVSRFRLQMEPGFQPEAIPWFTLRPKRGMRMVIEQRI